MNTSYNMKSIRIFFSHIVCINVRVIWSNIKCERYRFSIITTLYIYHRELLNIWVTIRTMSKVLIVVDVDKSGNVHSIERRSQLNVKVEFIHRCETELMIRRNHFVIHICLESSFKLNHQWSIWDEREEPMGS